MITFSCQRVSDENKLIINRVSLLCRWLKPEVPRFPLLPNTSGRFVFGTGTLCWLLHLWAAMTHTAVYMCCMPLCALSWLMCAHCLHVQLQSSLWGGRGHQPAHWPGQPALPQVDRRHCPRVRMDWRKDGFIGSWLHVEKKLPCWTSWNN